MMTSRNYLFSIGLDDLVSIIFDYTGLNAHSYIGTVLNFDAIIKNEDRHFGNLSVIKDKKGYRFSPIFDNGLSCLSDVISYPFNVSLVENIKRVYSKPFYFSFRNQLDSKYAIGIDYERFLENTIVKSREATRALDVIKYGINELEGIAWVRF